MNNLFGKYSHTLAFAGVVGVTAPSYFLSTWGLKHKRHMLASYDGAVEKPVSSHLISIFERVLGLVDVPKRKFAMARFDQGNMIDRIKLFATKKMDPVHAGTVNLKTDAIIGLPMHFNYRSLQDIDLDLLHVPYTNVDWDTFSGERFCNAIVLSDAAKAFVIAREVMMCKTYHIIGSMVLKALFSFGTYGFWYYLDLGLLLHRRLPAIGRLGVFGVVAAIGYVIYTAFADVYQCWHEKGADRTAAKLGWAYAQGGLEFYEKTLARNKALRKLLEHEGEKLFTPHGNEVSYVRRRHVQLTERKASLEGYCKWYDDKTKNKLQEHSEGA